MNKTELINAITLRLDNQATEGEIDNSYYKKDVAIIVNAALSEIFEELVAGGEVKVTPLGKFSVTEVAERMGHNPQTGEALTIPAHKKVRFTVSSTLREQVK